MVLTFDPSMLEAEAGRLRVQGQPRLHGSTLPQTTTTTCGCPEVTWGLECTKFMELYASEVRNYIVSFNLKVLQCFLSSLQSPQNTPEALSLSLALRSHPDTTPKFQQSRPFPQCWNQHPTEGVFKSSKSWLRKPTHAPVGGPTPTYMQAAKWTL